MLLNTEPLDVIEPIVKQVLPHLMLDSFVIVWKDPVLIEVLWPYISGVLCSIHRLSIVDLESLICLVHLLY